MRRLSPSHHSRLHHRRRIITNQNPFADDCQQCLLLMLMLMLLMLMLLMLLLSMSIVSSHEIHRPPPNQRNPANQISDHCLDAGRTLRNMARALLVAL